VYVYKQLQLKVTTLHVSLHKVTRAPKTAMHS